MPFPCPRIAQQANVINGFAVGSPGTGVKSQEAVQLIGGLLPTLIKYEPVGKTEEIDEHDGNWYYIAHIEPDTLGEYSAIARIHFSNKVIPAPAPLMGNEQNVKQSANRLNIVTYEEGPQAGDSLVVQNPDVVQYIIA